MVCALLCASHVRAQDNCATAVTRAAKSYEIGNLGDVVTILTPCLGSLSSDDAWQAYRLLALSYLFQDQPAKADTAIDEMLRINPRYERNPERDPYEFTRALDRYDWYPLLSFSARIGASIASPNVLRTYSLDAGAGTQATYSGGLGTTFGVGMEFHLSRSLSVGAEVLSLTSVYTRESSNAFNFQTSYTEHLSYFTVPVFAKYELRGGTFAPFITAGVVAQFLPSATASVNGTDGVGGKQTSSSDIQSTERRVSFVPGFMIGGGVQYALSTGSLSASVRYLHGMVDNTVASQRYANTTLLYGYYFMDDDVAMRNIECSISYEYHVNFRPVKIGDHE